MRDETPATIMAMSLLRLGICKPDDWDGSAVAMMNRAFVRMCRAHKCERINTWLDSSISITDVPFDLNEYERNQSEPDPAEGTRLYLNVDYNMSQVVPLRGILELMEEEHELLPACFFMALNAAFHPWTVVYGYGDAQPAADSWLEDLTEKELEENMYSMIKKELPRSMSMLPMLTAQKIDRAAMLRRFALEAKDVRVREIIASVLRAETFSKQYRKLRTTDDVLAEFGDEFEYPLPGVVLTWDPEDGIQAMFDEEMSGRQQGGCRFLPTLLEKIDLTLPAKQLDARVKYLMDLTCNMLQALDLLVGVIVTCGAIHDSLCKDRRKRELPTEAGVNDLR